MLSNAALSGFAKPPFVLGNVRRNSCQVSHGATSAAWVTGCGMPMTGSTWISCGGRRRHDCQNSQQMRGGRWRIYRLDRVYELKHAPCTPSPFSLAC